MTTELRDYAGASVPTTLSGPITDSDTAITIANATGWATGSGGKFFIVVDEGLSTEEHIKILSRSGTSLTVASSGRGADGTTAVAHALGASVRAVFTANDATLLNQHAANTTLDDHTQYVHNTVARTVSADHDFVGDPTFTGTPEFTGNPLFTGTPHFTGTPTFDHMGTTADLVAISGTTASAGESLRPMRSDARLALTDTFLNDIRWLRGEIKTVIGSASAPAGSVELLGQTGFSKTAYPGTWADYQGTAAIETGPTTFSLIDGRGYALVGAGAGGAHGVAEKYGSDTHTMTQAELFPHTHTFSGTAHGHTATSPPHAHGIPRAGGGSYSAGATNYVPNNSGGTDQSPSFDATVSVSVANTTAGGTNSTTGGGTPFSVVQASIGVRLFIRLY